MAGYLLLILGKRHAKMQKTRKSMPGTEEAGMLKCRKREKACQGRRSRHAKMRKTRKSMPGQKRQAC